MKQFVYAAAATGLMWSASAQADERSRLRVEFSDVQADLEGYRWHVLSSDPNLSKPRRSGEFIYGLADGEHQIRIIKPANPAATCQLGDNEGDGTGDNDAGGLPDDGGGVFVRPAVMHQFVQSFVGCGSVQAAVASETSLKVNLTPSAAVTGGAKWAIDPEPNQEINWYGDGQSVPVSQGDHLVVFKPVDSGPCQVTPPNQAVAVYFGASTISVAYGGQNC